MATRRRRDDQPADADADATATTGPQAKKPKPSPGVSLPEELITEVLLRLPARSLARLRCVRRSWDAEITSAGFVDRHLALAAAKPKIAFVPVGDDHRFLARWHQHMHLDQPFAVPMECGGCPRLVGAKACHGLVLVERRCGGGDDDPAAAFLSVCNPSTGGTMDLPALYRQAQSGVHVVAGIGFDAPAGQYMVVAHLRRPLSPRPSEAVPEAYCVVTLGVDRSWRFRFRRVPGHDDSALHYAFVDGGPVFADGCLHWTYSESSSDDDVRVTRGILSFSLSDESFRQAPQPAFPAPDAAGVGKCSVVSSWREARGRPVGCLGTATLAELGGSLCLVRDVRGCRGVVHGQLQVWKLEDYGIHALALSPLVGGRMTVASERRLTPARRLTLARGIPTSSPAVAADDTATGSFYGGGTWCYLELGGFARVEERGFAEEGA
ncbi:hypothetical protein ACP70R_011661 [Stipagrostis hirtigluma subsp. patula]